jgi:hypothetical protein
MREQGKPMERVGRTAAELRHLVERTFAAAGTPPE